MKRLLTFGAFLFAILSVTVSVQSPQRLVPYSGSVIVPDGQAPPSSATVTFSLYQDQLGGEPLWVEAQTVDLDSQGRYTVILGSKSDGGLPAELFGIGTPRWLGVRADGAAEQPRLQLLAVPYAVAAGSAASLGGRAADDFVLTENLPKSVRDQVKRRAEGTDGTVETPITSAIAGRLVKYADGAGTLTDSAVSEGAGRVGIGTATPNYAEHIHGLGQHAFLQFTSNLTGSTATDGAYFGVADNDTVFRLYNFENSNIEFWTQNLRRMTVGGTGNIGIGVQNANYPLQLHNTGHNLIQFTNSVTGTGPTDGSYFGLIAGQSTFRIYNFENAGIEFYTDNIRRMLVTEGGRVGIGTAAPATMLHVAGDALVDGNIGAKYQDVAEWVDASEPIEAGTIVVIDPDLDHYVRASGSVYQLTVAGAVSAQPGLILGEKGPNKVMVAQSGRVRIKVDASFGAIKSGDLLVTSPTPGHAMKSQPFSVGGVEMHRPGTIIGKALEPLESGQGEVLALLTLQ